MRVLHLLASADRRGAEVFGTQLAARLDELGHVGDVVALTAAGDPAGGLDVEVVPALRSPKALVALRRRAATADVVLAHGSRGLVAGTAATVASRRPLVYRSIGDPTYWGSSRARRARVRAQLRRAARVTALWPAAADALRSTYGLEGRVVVVPNAADERRFSPCEPDVRAEARRSIGIDDDRAVVLVVGAMSPEKRIGLAVDAVALVPGAHLVLAGDGPERPSVTAAATSSLAGRHAILGAVADVAPLYRAADVVLITSATEGQPGAAIEAGLAGLPVVSTDVGGVASVVDHQVTGVLVAPDAPPAALADAIGHALVDRDALGRAARQRALDRFSLDAVAAQFAQVLQEAIDA